MGSKKFWAVLGIGLVALSLVAAPVVACDAAFGQCGGGGFQQQQSFGYAAPVQSFAVVPQQQVVYPQAVVPQFQQSYSVQQQFVPQQQIVRQQVYSQRQFAPVVVAAPVVKAPRLGGRLFSGRGQVARSRTVVRGGGSAQAQASF